MLPPHNELEIECRSVGQACPEQAADVPGSATPTIVTGGQGEDVEVSAQESVEYRLPKAALRRLLKHTPEARTGAHNPVASHI